MAQTAVAAKTEVSIQSVRRIEREAPVTTSERKALVRQHRIGRPSVATPWTAMIEGWLAEDRGLPSGEIVRRLREEQGYAGGKSAVYELVRRLRPVAIAPMVRFEGVAGEFSQHDFGQIEVRYTAGARERIRFFASRLKWSRLAHVSLVPDEREEAPIRALLAAFEVFGGVPLVTVWDNPKTVVLSRKGDLIVWNPTFGQVALDYRFAPELCWPRAGQQKGAVENLIGWVKGSFFRCRRFHDRADLEAQLAQWLTTVNTQRPSRATGEIPVKRLTLERARLRPLPIPAAAYALKIPVVVSARSRVRHDGHEYSMPPATLGQAATLHLYPDRIEIVTKTQQVVRHPRGSDPLSLLPEHRAAMLDAVRGGRARLYYQRQSLWELGPAAEMWLTELVHRRPTQWRRDVEQCFALLQAQGPTRLLAALAWGVTHHAIGAEYVTSALQRAARRKREPLGAPRTAFDEGGRYVGIPRAGVSEVVG